MSIGTFVKTAAPQIIEILSLSGLNFAVIDAEHAPFDRRDIDTMVLAGRASDLPIFVRVPDHSPATLLSCLDVGVAGVVVPHVDTVEQAIQIVGYCRYRNGQRGYSSSPRSSGYGSLGMKSALENGDSARLICQIESDKAVDAAAEIAKLDGVYGLLIGRADLALSMGFDTTQTPEVEMAVLKVIQAAKASNRKVVMAVGDGKELEKYRALGADWFVLSSDQGLLRRAAIEAFGSKSA
jgi:2-keto-3-deoxy-L-rhamnonate aldolase RhmA